MCGIAVIFGENADRYQRELSQMLAALESRGEVTETFIHSQVVTGTRRLKIVDREQSKQPIFNATGDKLVVFNGEIFNFQEIRAQLSDKYLFQTNGDTELILSAFEEYGKNCLDWFEGQFSFIIVDLKENRLFFARDPLGIIPLYFVRKEGLLYLASNIKALTHLKEPIQVLSPGCFQESDSPQVQYFQPSFQPSNRQLSDFLPHLKNMVRA
ncbi:MAG: hypothetical protein F6K41_39100 [Symploca sp. SIO3E6]|nr:hypothetical protein [Caldora sp. SIO3E6]